MKDDKVYLKIISRAIKKIKSYVKKVKDGDEFSNDELVRDAVMKNIGDIGEMSKKLPSSFRKNHDQINWQKIIDAGNLFFDINYMAIWEIIEKDLPKLEKQIKLTIKEKSSAKICPLPSLRA